MGDVAEGFSALHHRAALLLPARDSGARDLLNEALVGATRVLGGRAEEPTTAIIDSQ
jgi:hypothetical protein